MNFLLFVSSSSSTHSLPYARKKEVSMTRTHDDSDSRCPSSRK